MRKLTITGNANQPVSGAKAKTFAIFDAGPNGTDYAPFLNPKAHLDRVALHSDFDYIGVVSTLTASIVLPAGTFPSDNTLSTFNLGAHGRPGRPFVIAEASLDNINWSTVNGTTFTAISLSLRGRSFHIQVDSTNVYAIVNQIGSWNSPQTIWFRVHILQRSFGDARPNDGKAFRATPSRVTAAGGVFDTDRRYLQTPTPGQTAQIFYTSGQTLKIALGDEGVGSSLPELDLGFGSHGNNLNLPLADTWSTSWPPFIVQGQRTELVFAGEGSLSTRVRFSPSNMQMSNAAGDIIFDASRKILSFTDEIKKTLTVPSRAAVSNDVPHDVVLSATPVTAGASEIFGYLELKSAGMRIASFKPLDFSGAIIITGFFFVQSGFLFVRALSIVYPRLANGNLEIVEHYYNRVMAGAQNTALPTYTFDVHMMVGAMTGGI